jgi:mRNA interferase HigB
MRIISKSKLKKLASENYPDAKSAIQAWTKLVENQEWNNFAELKANSVFDVVKNFVVFDIGGNKYRLITYIDYKTKTVFIRNFLTHAEYDKDKWKEDEWFSSD